LENLLKHLGEGRKVLKQMASNELIPNIVVMVELKAINNKK
jgi:hypothetical protein